MINYCCSFWCDWIYSLNPLEVIIAAMVGIVTGLLASKIFAKTTERNKRNRLDKKYKPLEGTYIRWFKEDKQTGEGRIHAKAHLKHYIGEYRLDIKVETFINPKGYDLDNIQEWTGEVVMDTIRSGTVVWEQRKPDNGNNGFKRIIVEKNQDGITLVGEADQGFGVERFTEKETNAS